MTRKTPVSPWPAEPVFLRKSATCPKLGLRSSGTLGYEIATTASDCAYLRLCSNDSGGYFSTEWLELPAVLALLDRLGEQTFAARTLQPLFVGRSANNASFLAAVLLAEGLLQKSEAKAGALQCREHAHYLSEILAMPLGEEIRPPTPTTLPTLEPDPTSTPMESSNRPAWPIGNSLDGMAAEPPGSGSEEVDPMFQKRSSRKSARKALE